MKGVASLLVLAAIVHARPSAAQNQKAAAEGAFRHGKDLMAAGKIAEACASFETSQKIDPQLGTQYNLALCYDKLGKTASAWANFSELAARDTNAHRKADSDHRAKTLEPRLTHMRIDVTEKVAGLVVTQDGVDITALIGVESPVDPGDYDFKATAPNHATWESHVALGGEGATIVVAIPALTATAAPTPAPTPSEGANAHDEVEDALAPLDEIARIMTSDGDCSRVGGEVGRFVDANQATLEKSTELLKRTKISKTLRERILADIERILPVMNRCGRDTSVQQAFMKVGVYVAGVMQLAASK